MRAIAAALLSCLVLLGGGTPAAANPELVSAADARRIRELEPLRFRARVTDAEWALVGRHAREVGCDAAARAVLEVIVIHERLELVACLSDGIGVRPTVHRMLGQTLAEEVVVRRPRTLRAGVERLLELPDDRWGPRAVAAGREWIAPDWVPPYRVMLQRLLALQHARRARLGVPSTRSTRIAEFVESDEHWARFEPARMRLLLAHAGSPPAAAIAALIARLEAAPDGPSDPAAWVLATYEPAALPRVVGRLAEFAPEGGKPGSKPPVGLIQYCEQEVHRASRSTAKRLLEIGAWAHGLADKRVQRAATRLLFRTTERIMQLGPAEKPSRQPPK